MIHIRAFAYQRLVFLSFAYIFPLNTRRKLNVHKTFRTRPGCLQSVLCTFHLPPPSRGLNKWFLAWQNSCRTVQFYSRRCIHGAVCFKQNCKRKLKSTSHVFIKIFLNLLENLFFKRILEKITFLGISFCDLANPNYATTLKNELRQWLFQELNTWAQNVNWTCIRRSEEIPDVFWTSYLRSIYVHFSGGIQLPLFSTSDNYLSAFEILYMARVFTA